MRLYSYTMTSDTGLAPNPFWGYCTLALCTPNHGGAQPEPGDWLMGTETLDKGSKLIYAMEVWKTLSFGKYFIVPEFQNKKAVSDKTWREACGDNIYSKNASGEWVQHFSPYHNTEWQKLQDTKHPRVFVSLKFWYFGENAVKMPENFEPLIHRRNYKYKHNEELVEHFLHWLQRNFTPGLHGEPRDRPRDKTRCTQVLDNCAAAKPSRSPICKYRCPTTG